MNPAIALRAANNTDSPRLAALSIQVWLHTYATNGIAEPDAHYVLNEFTIANMRARLDNANTQILVAEQAESLRGYVALRSGSHHADIACEIETLYVQAHFARHGIGGALFNAARAAALNQTGSAAVWLKVNAQNKNAMAFYASKGMVVDGETWFELDGTKHKNWIMRTVV